MPKNLNRIILRLLEVALGLLFVYAGVQKSFNPYDFAEAVLAYRLVPDSLAGVAASVIPWAELAPGILLALGLKRRSSLLIIMLLAGGFLLVMIITMARGLKIDCGCGLFYPRQVGLGAILEDALLVFWAAGLYYWELRAALGAKSSPAPPSSSPPNPR